VGFYIAGAFQFHEFLLPLYITLLLDFYRWSIQIYNTKIQKYFISKGIHYNTNINSNLFHWLYISLWALREFAWSKASVTESIDPVNIAFCRQHSPLEMDDHPVEQMNQSSLEIPHNNSSPHVWWLLIFNPLLNTLILDVQHMSQCLIKVIWLRSDQVSDVPKVMYRKLENLISLAFTCLKHWQSKMHFRISLLLFLRCPLALSYFQMQ
jgi:hypothetical protein